MELAITGFDSAAADTAPDQEDLMAVSPERLSKLVSLAASAALVALLWPATAAA